MNVDWTLEEDTILVKYYGILPYKEILKFLPKYRTVSGIRNRVLKLNICVKRGKNKFSVTNPRKKVDDNFFSDLSLLNCYWAGFIAADGCIKKDNILKIKLGSKDIFHIETFIKDINYEGNICNQKSVSKSGKSTFSSEVSILSEKICNDLNINFNIHNNKTKTYKFPSLPDEFIDSFISGYIDGNGCIGYYGSKQKQKYLNIIIVGTYDVCEKIKNRFENIINKNINIFKDKKTKHLYGVRVTRQSAELIYNKLKSIKIPKLKRKWDFHTKNWGYERWIVNNNEYCGKLLYFNKGKRCSWHKHEIKKETFYLHSGEMILKYSLNDADINNAIVRYLNPGDSFDIPIGMIHQMIAVKNSELYEFSTKHFDSDSYRVIKGD